MKQVFLKAVLVLLVAVSATKKANADADSASICLKDPYGGVWQLEFTKSDSLYIAHGDAYLSGNRDWPAWGFYNAITGETELHAVNPHPDGCATYSDSFVNFGTGRGLYNKRIGEYQFEASGYQRNYCGSQNQGGPDDWSIKDCSRATLLRSGTTAPKLVNGQQAKSSSAFILKVSPNPVSSIAAISYSLGEKSTVSLLIFRSTGELVKTITDKETKLPGTYTIKWDSNSSNNIPVGSGLYRVVALINNKPYSAMVQVAH